MSLHRNKQVTDVTSIEYIIPIIIIEGTIPKVLKM